MPSIQASAAAALIAAGVLIALPAAAQHGSGYEPFSADQYGRGVPVAVPTQAPTRDDSPERLIRRLVRGKWVFDSAPTPRGVVTSDVISGEIDIDLRSGVRGVSPCNEFVSSISLNPGNRRRGELDFYDIQRTVRPCDNPRLENAFLMRLDMADRYRIRGRRRDGDLRLVLLQGDTELMSLKRPERRNRRNVEAAPQFVPQPEPVPVPVPQPAPAQPQYPQYDSGSSGYAGYYTAPQPTVPAQPVVPMYTPVQPIDPVYGAQPIDPVYGAQPIDPGYGAQPVPQVQPTPPQYAEPIAPGVFPVGSYRVDVILGAAGALESVDASSGATVSFEASGSINGNGGCNNFQGSYTASGTELSVSGLGAARQYCYGDVSGNEQLLFQHLAGAKSWSFNGYDLFLFGPSGETTVILRR